MGKDDWNGEPRRKTDTELTDIKISLSNINQSINAIKDLQERHDEILFGKDRGEGGIILEVNRFRDMKKHVTVAWSALIGLIIKSVWDWMIRR